MITTKVAIVSQRCNYNQTLNQLSCIFSRIKQFKSKVRQLPLALTSEESLTLKTRIVCDQICFLAQQI